MLYLSTIIVISYQVKMLMFFNVQTTDLTFVGKNLRNTVNSYNIV